MANREPVWATDDEQREGVAVSTRTFRSVSLAPDVEPSDLGLKGAPLILRDDDTGELLVWSGKFSLEATRGPGEVLPPRAPGDASPLSAPGRVPVHAPPAGPPRTPSTIPGE
jgi:hypothetical protein